jgi:hypothetical protein
MDQSYYKKFKVSVDTEKQTVSLSIRVTDDVVNVYKSTMSEFSVMIAEYESLLYSSAQAQNSLENNQEITQ